MTDDTILIVDDNPANLKVARYALETEGYDVAVAHDAEEAIALMRELRPRLILMDIQLPGMDGLELTRLIKADPAKSEIVIIAVTAYAMVGDLEKAFAAGCDGYISKPLDPILLPSQIADHIARAGHVIASVKAGRRPDRTSHDIVLGPDRIDSSAEGPRQVILVVDDNAATCRMYRAALETAGHTVLEAHTGRAAIHAVQFQRPALIIQDMVLSDMDGFELVRRLREEAGPNPMPIVCASGFLMQVDEKHATTSGFAQVLVKPIDPFHLVDVVKIHLRASSKSSEQLGEGRILVVADDDALQRKLAEVRFSIAGFRVLVAASGAEALELARRERPVAIVSDVLMPQTDGFMLSHEVRNDPTLAGVLVILTSAAYDEKADHELAKRVGASALLRKDGDFESVFQFLLAHLDDSPRKFPGEPAEAIEKEHVRRQQSQLERQVVENTSLLRRTMLHQAQAGVLSGVADALGKNELVDAVLGDVLAACLDMAGICKGALYIRKSERAFDFKYQIGFSEAETFRLRTRFENEDLFFEAARLSKAIAVPSPEVNAEMAQRLLAAAGVTSLLLVPVTNGYEACGVLLMGSRTVEVLDDPNTTALALVLGSQIGQALGLTQAFETLSASELRYRVLATELKQTADALQTSETKVRSLLENASQGILTADGHGRIVDANQMVQQLFGYNRDELIGASVSILLPENLCAAHITSLSTETQQPPSDPGKLNEGFVIRRKNGSDLAAEISFSHVVEYQTGGMTMAFISDVSARKQAEREREVLISMLETALAEKTVLIQEVHHRVRNNLAVIAGLLSLQAGAQEDGEARRTLEESQRRIESMALIHEYLYDSENMDRVKFGAYLRKLAKEISAVLVLDPKLTALKIDVEEIELPVHYAIPCGLIMNEFLTDLFKDALAVAPERNIGIRFCRLESGDLLLSCSNEDVRSQEGSGELQSPSPGLEIVRILTKQIGGTLRLGPGGAVTGCEVRFPAPLPALARRSLTKTAS